MDDDEISKLRAMVEAAARREMPIGCTTSRHPVLAAGARTAKLKGTILLVALVSGCATVPNVGSERETQRQLAPTGGAAYDEGVAAFRTGDYAKALRDFGAAGTAGDSDAIFFQAMMYEQGCGVEEDHAKAEQLLEQAAAAHSAAA